MMQMAEALKARLRVRGAMDGARMAAGTLYVAPDGDVLLLRRATNEGNFAGHWSLPGGGAEEGETPEQTADREAVEEIGQAPDGKKKLIGKTKTPTGVICHTFAQMVAEKFRPTLNSEHDGYMWVPLAELMRHLETPGATDMARDDSDWNESKHPRAENGQFGSGGSAAHAGAVGTGAKEHPGIRNGVDSGEAASIKHYTAEGFKPINWGLRGIRPPTSASAAHTTEIDRVMSRSSLPEAMTVHRGIGGNGLKAMIAGYGLKKGRVITDPGFLSASKNAGVVKSFQNSADNISMEIRLPKGAKAIDLGRLSDNPGESEVLIDRNAKLKVVSFDKKAKKAVFEVIP